MHSDLPFVIGLDVSKTRTGVAFGRVGDTPRFASVCGTDISDGAAGFKLMSWLGAFTKDQAVDHVFYEAQIPHIPSEYDHEKQRVVAKGSPFTLITLGKMIAAVEFACRGRSVPCSSVAISTLRAAFVGHGRLKKDPAKKAAHLMCKELGWTPRNMDESDSAAVWWYGCRTVKPHQCQIITPMMQRKVVSIATNPVSVRGAS